MATERKTTKLLLFEGLVCTEDGRALAGASIIVSKATKALPERGIRTNAKGEFLLPLPAGTFEITAAGPGDLRGSATISVPAGPRPKKNKLTILSGSAPRGASKPVLTGKRIAAKRAGAKTPRR